jgi:hypothetical protein
MVTEQQTTKFKIFPTKAKCPLIEYLPRKTQDPEFNPPYTKKKKKKKPNALNFTLETALARRKLRKLSRPNIGQDI